MMSLRNNETGILISQLVMVAARHDGDSSVVVHQQQLQYLQYVKHLLGAQVQLHFVETGTSSARRRACNVSVDRWHRVQSCFSVFMCCCK